VRSDREPFLLADAPASDVERGIAEYVSGFISDGCTLQTGIGGVPSLVARMLADGPGGDYGVHSEMFTTGLMYLHQAGKITNRKGVFDGVSVTTFSAGTKELYEWLHENHDVAFLPVDIVNSPEVIARNRKVVTINGALSVDLYGQAIADSLGGRQFSGIGGHEDFVSISGFQIEDRSLLCVPSTAKVSGQLVSRIVPTFPAGSIITTPRHHLDVVITEYGAAELRGHTVRERAFALAEVAHPEFRDELRERAASMPKA
jgi:acyl-CoA hydrolase